MLVSLLLPNSMTDSERIVELLTEVLAEIKERNGQLSRMEAQLSRIEDNMERLFERAEYISDEQHRIHVLLQQMTEPDERLKAGIANVYDVGKRRN
jgi:predicted nuclease with TOPRIM domain